MCEIELWIYFNGNRPVKARIPCKFEEYKTRLKNVAENYDGITIDYRVYVNGVTADSGTLNG